MAPLIVLVVASAAFWFAGRLGVRDDISAQQHGSAMGTGADVLSYSICPLGQDTARSDPHGAAELSAP